MTRSILLATIILLGAGCGAKKQSAEAAVEQQEANAGFSTGTVSLDMMGDGCPLVITLDGVDKVFLVPIGLDDLYKKNGLKLRFKYRPSRASIGECRKGQAAILEEISLPPTKPQGQLQDK
jgi:hypothetical protein